MKIAICDVGLGNLRSVERALRFAADELSTQTTFDIRIERDPEIIRRADKIVMPGQGAFRDCAAALDAGLGAVVCERVRAGIPYLGICLGLQVLFGSSEEAPGCKGLGLFPGRVVRLGEGIDATTGSRLKIPHVGWNVADQASQASLDAARASSAKTQRAVGPMGALLPEEPTHFYFVHSYAVVPDDESLTASTTTYGTPFVSAIARDNVFACQFHPEKSQRAGIDLLKRFLLPPSVPNS